MIRLTKAGAAIFLVCACLAVRAQIPDEKGVRAVADAEIAGWAKFDAKAIASLYAPDATWQNPFGVRFHNSVDLEKFLNNLFARPGYRSAKDTAAPKILDIHFPSPDVAVLWEDESSEGQIDDATGKPMLPRHSYYMQVLVKGSTGWKISECMIMDQVGGRR